MWVYQINRKQAKEGEVKRKHDNTQNMSKTKT